MEIMMEYLGKGFLEMLIISMPCVFVAAGIGLVVGILQAVTQVQEQTIAAAPKILGVFLVIIIFGSAFTDILVNYIQEGVNLAFNVVTRQDEFVLETDNQTGKTSFFNSRKDYNSMKNQPDVDKLMNSQGQMPYAQNKAKVKIEGATPESSNASFLEKKKISGH